MKPIKIIYYISTVLLTGLMLFSAGMYFTKTEMIQEYFVSMHYPAYIPIPLAIAKILGLVAIWTNLSKSLKEWAYAGFFFDTVLAVVAHLNANDGGHLMAVMGIAFVLTSYITGKKKNEEAF